MRYRTYLGPDDMLGNGEVIFSRPLDQRATKKCIKVDVVSMARGDHRQGGWKSQRGLNRYKEEICETQPAPTRFFSRSCPASPSGINGDLYVSKVELASDDGERVF